VSATHKEQATLELLAAYRDDLERFAKDCLRIRDKEGKVQLFPGFNSAQRYVHARLEEQKKKTGRVRGITLKGRQQGISTYIAARYYARATLHRGIGVYILSHEQTASDNLFKMVDRFQVHNPIRPHTGVSNVKELEFDKLDSSYVVATAGQKAGGRGRTISLFHGSEVAFWQSAADHFASSVQTVPDMPGTEILLESTGNGASGEFYERWQDAMAGVGDYIPIFVPWFWQEEYRREVPYDFELSTEPGDNGVSEKEYAALFDLSFEQMAWRRAKVAELRSVQLFDQEYPASPEMAFSSADAKRSFILPIQVLRARKRKGVTAAGPLIIGADPSGPGKDRFAVAARQGCRVLWIDHRQVPETPEAVEWLRQLIDDHKPDRLYIDLANIGHAVYTYLRAKGDPYRSIVRGINFGAVSQAKLALPKVPGPKNRRAEMWDRSREWLLLPEGVQLPDNDALQADATAPRVKPLLNNDFLLESKEDMRRRGVRSPDLWDAVILTFAELERIVQSEQRLKDEQKTTSLMPAFTPSAPSSGAFQLPAGSPNGWMA
jgi:hypothetical protein